MTTRATAAGCMMLRIEATEPPLWVGPCMTAASSSTTPSSLGSPPSPTEWSLGSASTMATPSIAASSGSCPFLTSSMAFSTVRRPLPLAIAIGRFDPTGLTDPAPIASVATLAVAVEAMKRRRLIIFLMDGTSPGAEFSRSLTGTEFLLLSLLALGDQSSSCPKSPTCEYASRPLWPVLTASSGSR